MLLNLSNPFKMDVDTGGKITHYSGTFREMKKEEKREFDERNDSITSKARHYKKLMLELNRKQKRSDLAERAGKFDEALKMQDDIESLQDEIQAGVDEFNETDERETMMRDRLELCLGGNDRDKLIDIADENGYERVFNVIVASVSEAEEERLKKLKRG